jgi:hypothetical protein
LDGAGENLHDEDKAFEEWQKMHWDPCAPYRLSGVFIALLTPIALYLIFPFSYKQEEEV